MGVLSERLEAARQRVQGRWQMDMRAWWEALQGEDYRCSYSAARNWHQGDREPPAAYLARVCDVHNVNPDFLLLGKRPVLRDGRPARRARRALEELRAEIDDVVSLLPEDDA